MKPYYEDESVTLWHGDAALVLDSMPAGSVDCIVTSPPYFGLRDYGVEGQVGAEESPAEFVASLVAVFTEARRVLADDGTLWLNLGDSYSFGSTPIHNTNTPNRNRDGSSDDASVAVGRSLAPRRQNSGLPAKNMLGMPWRVAFALQDAGWILRNEIIWAKPNAMPESVTDRLSTRHEHLFLLTKSPRYWFDLDAVREPAETADRTGPRRSYAPGSASSMSAGGEHQEMAGPFAGLPLNPLGRNPGDVWTINTTPFSGAHFATFPVELPARCIKAGCKPGGTVLDTFSGSGATGLAAARLGRKYVGIDLNADYLDLSLRTRLSQPGLDFGEGA